MTTQSDALQPGVDDADILGAIMDAAVDAIVVSDEAGRILRANSSAHELFNHPDGSLVGQNVSVLLPDMVADHHDEYMARYLRTGVAGIIGRGRDVMGQRRDGKPVPLHLSIGEAQSSGGSRFVAIIHDLGERRAAAAALAQSQRLDAIGQMAGGIAHDFNNFLTVIIGNLELLETRVDDPRTRNVIEQVLETAELAADLTSRLMLFARRGELHSEDTDLSVICRRLLEMLRRTVGQRIRINTRFETSPPLVRVDTVQLQSAILNLIINARDAMPDGGEIDIAIQTVSIDDEFIAEETHVAPGRYVRLTVSDDGTGMDDETCQRAFEPFFSTKQGDEGTGLGLALVYGFVRQSGGEISVYSTPGVGTSFALYFPVVETDSAIEERRMKSGEADLANVSGLVLVVDDNAKVRDISVNRIKALGYDVEAASSGDEAWQMIKGGLRPDVVFTDLVMPGDLNGLDLADRISRLHPGIGILLTSGFASEVAAARQDANDRFPLLHKPYHQQELAMRLREILR